MNDQKTKTESGRQSAVDTVVKCTTSFARKAVEIIILIIICAGLVAGGVYVMKHQSSAAFELGMALIIGGVLIFVFYFKESS